MSTENKKFSYMFGKVNSAVTQNNLKKNQKKGKKKGKRENLYK